MSDSTLRSIQKMGFVLVEGTTDQYAQNGWVLQGSSSVEWWELSAVPGKEADGRPICLFPSLDPDMDPPGVVLARGTTPMVVVRDALLKLLSEEAAYTHDGMSKQTRRLFERLRREPFNKQRGPVYAFDRYYRNEWATNSLVRALRGLGRRRFHALTGEPSYAALRETMQGFEEAPADDLHEIVFSLQLTASAAHRALTYTVADGWHLIFVRPYEARARSAFTRNGWVVLPAAGTAVAEASARTPELFQEPASRPTEAIVHALMRILANPKTYLHDGTSFEELKRVKEARGESVNPFSLKGAVRDFVDFEVLNTAADQLVRVILRNEGAFQRFSGYASYAEMRDAFRAATKP